VVALALDPARQTDGVADVIRAKLSAGMGAVEMHLFLVSTGPAGYLDRASSLTDHARKASLSLPTDSTPEC
jgi:hypothetical protein